MKIEEEIKNIKEVLTSGGIVAVPTDTVYGLICDATNEKAVKRLYQLKRRDLAKPIGIFVKDKLSISSIIDLNAVDEKVMDKVNEYMDKYWPGKLTIIFPKEEKTLQYINLQTKNSVAIRVPKVELLLKLMEEIDFPLAQTSCNVSNEKPYYKKIDIEKNMKVDYVTDYGIELLSVELIASTIISIMGGEIKIIRRGDIDIED